MGKKEVVVREYEAERDSVVVEQVERSCEVGPNSSKLSIFTDLLGDPLCRIRHSPAFLMLVAEVVEEGEEEGEKKEKREIVGMIRGCIKTVTCGIKYPRPSKSTPSHSSSPLPVLHKEEEDEKNSSNITSINDTSSNHEYYYYMMFQGPWDFFKVVIRFLVRYLGFQIHNSSTTTTTTPQKADMSGSDCDGGSYDCSDGVVEHQLGPPLDHEGIPYRKKPKKPGVNAGKGGQFN